ncbi:lecithin-cholesterol acyltransferase-like 4 [Vigna radiata var. radiata]|uniref:Lecithin-cholesterol acyltransferase-like 4 n=1 Tax=Vigna radiata var. radiata TaxID=3916 RepID=A0A1S3UTE1_VIGRR|nr:lecithin-cholesterol acyltransferase-like 4 [Vigna radiata var. radiata]
MAILLGEILQTVELWLKLMKKPQPEAYINPNLDPVLLVPGVGGSILHAVSDPDGSQERVWVRFLSAEYKLKTKLWSRYDPSTGKTESMDRNSTIMIPEDRHGLYAIDILDPDLMIGSEGVYYFHDMIVEMRKWGFEEGKTLFGFGYDFRQSNRLQETIDRLAAKLESIYNAAGGKKINIISHSMGGLLVKCFMCLQSDIFEKYVKNWVAITAPFQGAPGSTNATFLNGMSFVEGWEQNFFISKWSMHQLLIECPSVYELRGCPNFHWQHVPVLELWRERHDSEGKSHVVLESYPPCDSIEILKQALVNNTVNYDGEDIPVPFNLDILNWANKTWEILSSAKLPSQVKFYNIYGTNLETPHSVCFGSGDKPVTDLQKLRYFQAKYVFVDGDGTVPIESAKADGLNAEARVGVPGEHRGILREPHVFRLIKHWLKAGVPDPFYNPLNDFVILPTAFEIERYKEKGVEVASLKEEWEIISKDQDDLSNNTADKMCSISVSHEGANQSYSEAHATLVIHPGTDSKHVQLNALAVSVDAL